jgi:hypothetical protein
MLILKLQIIKKRVSSLGIFIGLPVIVILVIVGYIRRIITTTMAAYAVG